MSVVNQSREGVFGLSHDPSALSGASAIIADQRYSGRLVKREWFALNMNTALAAHGN